MLLVQEMKDRQEIWIYGMDSQEKKRRDLGISKDGMYRSISVTKYRDNWRTLGLIFLQNWV